MNITYEDRTNIGIIDGQRLGARPIFSFEYAWFLVTDTTAMFVATHNEEDSNQDMTPEQRMEVEEFYNNHIFYGVQPSFDIFTEKVIEDGTEVINGKTYTKNVVVALTEEELEVRASEVAVPEFITPLQAKLQLLEAELLDDIEELITTDKAASIYWTNSTKFYRYDPIMISMAAALGLSDKVVDQLFIAASKLGGVPTKPVSIEEKMIAPEEEDADIE